MCKKELKIDDPTAYIDALSLAIDTLPRVDNGRPYDSRRNPVRAEQINPDTFYDVLDTVYEQLIHGEEPMMPRRD